MDKTPTLSHRDKIRVEVTDFLDRRDQHRGGKSTVTIATFAFGLFLCRNKPPGTVIEFPAPNREPLTW